MKVDVSEAGQADLDDIVDFIWEQHPNAALAVVEDLRAFIATTLVRNPEIGRRADHLEPGVRVFVKGNYRICYRIRPGILEIIRFVHGARDIEALFR